MSSFLPFGRAIRGVVSLLSETVIREYRRPVLPHWPDGETPLIDLYGVMPQEASAAPAGRDQTARANHDAAESPAGESASAQTPAGRVDHNCEAASLVGAEMHWHRATVTDDLSYRCLCGEIFPFKHDWRWHLSEKVSNALN